MRMSLKECIAQMVVTTLLCCVAWPVFAQEAAPTPQMDEEADRAIREQIDKKQQEKDQRLKEEPRIKKANEYLLELEDIYKKDGKEAAKEYAKKRHFNVDEDLKIRVKIFLSIPVESFDDKLLVSFGGRVLGKYLGKIDALIPLDRIRDIVDHVDGIEYIGVSGRGVPAID